MEGYLWPQLEKQDSISISEPASTQNILSEKIGRKLISVEWLAGYVDGEGCFQIRNGNRQPYLSISSANYDLLRAIQEQYGGRVYKHGSATDRRRKSWVWRINGEHVEKLILKLLPYLREKATQAIGLLAWQSKATQRNEVIKNFITSEKKTYYEHLESE